MNSSNAGRNRSLERHPRLSIPPGALLAAGAALAALLCGPALPARAAEPGGAQAPSAPAEAQTSAASGVDLHPPDGVWLKDPDGVEYFLRRLPKVEGQYSRPGEGLVSIGPDTLYELHHEDAQAFHVKIYKRVSRPSARRAGPDPAESARLSASYRADVPASERLAFEPFDRGLPGRGQWRNGFDVADLNGDGSPDIVHGPARKSFGPPVVFLGDGKGNWTRWTEARFPRAPYDYGDAAAADFNGDGIQDIALAMHLRGLLVLVGDGRGQFQPWSRGLDLQGNSPEPGHPVYTSRAIRAADWNGDGQPDLLALGEGMAFTGRPAPGAGGLQPAASTAGFRVYLNQRDGSWRQAAAGPDWTFGDSLATGDLDGDGQLDALVSTSRVADRRLLRLGLPDGSWTAADLEPARPHGLTTAVAVADIDRDGRDDLVLAYVNAEGRAWRSGIDVLLATEDGAWQRRPLASEESRRGIHALGSGDLDGDGGPDVVAATEDGQLWIFVSDGKGFLTREQASSLKQPGGGCRGYRVQLRDLDADGKAEIIAGFAGEPEPYAVGEPQCTSGGSLRAWKARPASTQP